MLEITRCYGKEDVIFTGLFSMNVIMDKQYELTKRQKKLLLWSFRVYTLDGVSQEQANKNLLRVLSSFLPKRMRHNFKKYHTIKSIIWDVEQIFTSDNVEFDLVRYFAQVCGLSFKELCSSNLDTRVSKWYTRAVA